MIAANPDSYRSPDGTEYELRATSTGIGSGERLLIRARRSPRTARKLGQLWREVAQIRDREAWKNFMFARTMGTPERDAVTGIATVKGGKS